MPKTSNPKIIKSCPLVKNRKVHIAFVEDVNGAGGGVELSEEILVVATLQLPSVIVIKSGANPDRAFAPAP